MFLLEGIRLPVKTIQEKERWCLVAPELLSNALKSKQFKQSKQRQHLQQYVAPEVVFSSPIETRVERIRKFFGMPKWVIQSQRAIHPVSVTSFVGTLTMISGGRQTENIGMPVHSDPHHKDVERREQLIAQRDIAMLSRPLGTVSSLKMRLLTWMETPVDRFATLAQMRTAFPNEIPNSISSRVSELVKQGCLTVSHGVYSLKENY